MSFAILAQRRFNWHILNVLPVSYIISIMMAFAPFLGWDGFNDRLQLLLLVMLTLSAYKIWGERRRIPRPMIADVLPPAEP